MGDGHWENTGQRKSENVAHLREPDTITMTTQTTPQAPPQLQWNPLSMGSLPAQAWTEKTLTSAP